MDDVVDVCGCVVVGVDVGGVVVVFDIECDVGVVV